MLFFAELDEPMQQKICKHSSIPETKHDLVAITKKHRPNLDREYKPSLPIYIRPTPSIFAQCERSDAPVASFPHENGCRKEVFCSYCEKKDHKKRNVRKNPTMLSNAKKPSPIQLGHRLLQWVSLVWVIVRRKKKILLAGNDLWWFL